MKHECLFDGRALTLKSIGRGYARRFTFEADENSLNNNKNYFWSDNRPEGYAFEVEVISVNDKFTLYDANHVAQGTVEVVQIEVGTFWFSFGFFFFECFVRHTLCSLYQKPVAVHVYTHADSHWIVGPLLTRAERVPRRKS